ncbi:MAG: site-specific integrase, partial [Actinomycetia bacterium]|nr:site-specific integrase [Actinomycetes bacterium]
MTELIAAFLDHLRLERRLSSHTVRSYGSDLRIFADWCERQGLDLAAINHRNLRAWLAELDQARYSRRTINRHLSAVKTFFVWLVATGQLAEDP